MRKFKILICMLLLVCMGINVFAESKKHNYWTYRDIGEKRHGLVSIENPNPMIKIKAVSGKRTLVELGANFLKGEEAVKSVYVPGTVTHIYEGAFSDMKSLEQVNLQKGLRSIGAGAFANSTSLEKLKIPKSVIEVGKGVLKGSKLWNSKSDGPVVVDGILLGYKTDDITKVKKVKIPSDARVIAEGAFEGFTALQSVEMPNSVKVIGKEAFKGCTALKKVVIPKGVQKLEENTFLECASLEKVVFKGLIKSVHNTAFAQTPIHNGKKYRNFNKVQINASVVYDKEEVDSYIVKKGVKSIASMRDGDRVEWKKIVIPNTVQSLGDRALFGSWKINKLKMSKNLNYIGREVLGEKYFVDPFKTDVLYIDKYAFGMNPDAQIKNGVLKFKKGTKVLAEGICENRSDLEEVEIPKSVKNIPIDAFSGCENLRLVIIKGKKTKVHEHAFSQSVNVEIFRMK